MNRRGGGFAEALPRKKGTNSHPMLPVLAQGPREPLQEGEAPGMLDGSSGRRSRTELGQPHCRPHSNSVAKDESLTRPQRRRDSWIAQATAKAGCGPRSSSKRGRPTPALCLCTPAGRSQYLQGVSRKEAQGRGAGLFFADERLRAS